jgi:hypothetical protein
LYVILNKTCQQFQPSTDHQVVTDVVVANLGVGVANTQEDRVDTYTSFVAGGVDDLINKIVKNLIM